LIKDSVLQVNAVAGYFRLTDTRMFNDWFQEMRIFCQVLVDTPPDRLNIHTHVHLRKKQ